MSNFLKLELIPVRNLPWNSGTGMTFELGDGEAQLTQGFGGWESISRPQRVAITRFTGTDPLGQDIPILIESAGGLNGLSIEGRIKDLIYNARAKSDGYPSTVYRMQGPVWYTEKRWIIADIDWGEQLRSRYGWPVRQRATLKMLEFVNPDTIKVRRRPVRVVYKPKVGKGEDRRIRASGKQNLRQIAKKYYGTARVAKELGKRQKPPIRDPMKKLNKGRLIRLPNFVWNGENYKTVWPNLQSVRTVNDDGGVRP